MDTSSAVAAGARAVAIGGNADRSTIVTGDYVTVHVSYSAPEAHESHQRAIETLALVRQIAANQPAHVAIPPAPEAEQTRWSAKLDLVRELINSGKLASALAALDAMERDSAPPAVDVELERLHRYSGIVLYRVGRTAEARERLQKALTYNPREFSTLAIMAAVHSSLGHNDEAIGFAQRAVALDQASASAWAILCDAATAAGQEVDVPEAIARAPEVLVSRANAALVKEEWTSAIQLLEDAAGAAGASGYSRMLLLAHAYIARSRSSDPVHAACDLNAARRVVDELLVTVPEDDEKPRYVSQALLLRAAVRGRLGDADGELQDLRAAVRNDPSSTAAVFTLSAAYLERDRPGEAAELLADHPELGNDPMLGALRPSILRATGQSAEQVRSALIEALRRAFGAPNEAQIRTMLAEIALEAELIDAAVDLLATVTEADYWFQTILRARIADRSGDAHGANVLYRRAVETASTNDQVGARMEWASFLRRQGDLEAALAQLTAADAASADEDTRRRYVKWLHEAGDYERVAEVVDRANRDGIRSAWVLEVQSWLAHVRGDVPGELRTLSEWIKVEPGRADAHLNLAHAHLRLGDRETAAAVLDGFTHLSVLTPTEEMGFAQLLFEVGRVGAGLEMALHAVRRDRSDERLKGAFAHMFLSRRDSVLSTPPTKVAAGVHVVLVGQSGERQEYTIFADEPVDPSRGEYLPTDPVVQSLIGLTKGERVVRRPGAPTEAVYEVAELKPVLLHMFHQILSRFGQEHPDSRIMQQVHIGEEPSLQRFAPVIQSVFQRAAGADEAVRVYEELRVPLGSLAAILGRRIPDVYAYLAGTDGKHLYAEFGDALHFELAVREASQPTIVLTRSALLTAGELGFRHQLPEWFVRLIVPRSLVDDLADELRELEKPLGESRQTLSSTGGRLVLHEFTHEELRTAKAEREEVLRWVRDTCSVEPLPSNSLTTADRWWREAIGTSSYDSYVLGVALNIPVHADDLGLRLVSPGDCGKQVRGFSSSALLTSLHARRMLESAEYHRHLTRLVELQHVHVPVSSSLFEAVLFEAGFLVDPSVMRVFARLSGVYSLAQDAIDVAAELIRAVAKSTASHRLYAVATLCMEYLWDGHPQPGTLSAFAAAVRIRLYLLPLARDSFEQALNDFRQAR
jgi:tetratricopeptide (TPR) repeat protein